ncbi:MAG: T9SS type A sorting domain-containing protein [Candidatus Electryoneaceae bacterium]|nr:T9SS type A sorting domain-containing protein [Candidatus Electryoneaceae bacterium]
MKREQKNISGVLILCMTLLMVTSLQAQDELRIELLEGDNWVSINLTLDEDMFDPNEPRGQNVRFMWDQLRIDENAHIVIMIVDDRGRFYAPGANDYCNIPFWDVTKVYRVRVNRDAVAVWEGELVDADARIPLPNHRSVNLIPYYPSYELDAGAPDFYVLSPVLDNVVFASDDHGGFMLPGMEFSNMEPWRPGEGYLVCVSEGITLHYPEQQNGEPFRPQFGNHWDNPSPDQLYSRVLIKTINNVEPELGDQVAIFNSEGEIVGVGNVQDDVCGITTWDDYGDDWSLELLYWDESRQVELEVDMRIYRNYERPYYVGGVLIIEITTGMGVSEAIDVPMSYTLSPPYPNPFNAMATLNFSLKTSSQVQLRVFDVSGGLVETLLDCDQTSGDHTVSWDGGSVPSGIYLFQLQVNGNSSVTRGVLLR